MNKVVFILIGISLSIVANAQIDTVLLNEQASHLFPSFPIKSSFTSLIDRRNGMDYAYSANMESGLGIYDISNTGIIDPVLDWPISNFNNLDVATIEQRGNTLFVGIGDFQINTNTSSGLAIVDITNPLVPSIKDTWDSTIYKHGISHLLVKDNFAYLSTMADGIIILDITDENNIVFKSHLQLDLNFPAPSLNAHNARGLKLKNDTLFVCFDRGGLRVIDVTDKSNPTEVYKYINTTLNAEAAAAYNDITIKGDYAFVSVDYCGLEVLDISTIPFTSINWYNPWGCNTTNWSGASLHTNEMVLANNDSLLFIAAGQSELFVFDVTNPVNTTKIGEFGNLNDTLATHGLDVWNNKVILSFIHTPFHIPPFTPFYADPGGLKLLDYSILNLPTTIFETQINTDLLTVSPNPNYGDILYLNCKSEINTIHIYNAVGQLIFKEDNIYNKEYTIKSFTRESGVYLVAVKTELAEQLFRKIVIY